MLEKLNKMRIQKRLTLSSIITVGIASLATVIAIIFFFYIGNRYDYVLDYYAFPQGDIGEAMEQLAEIQSATRGAIGYDKTDRIQQMLTEHESAIAEIWECMDTIEESVVTDEARQYYNRINEALEAYLKLDAEVIELGATTDAKRSAEAQDMAFEELTPAYTTVQDAFNTLMEMNVEAGDKTKANLDSLQIILVLVLLAIIAAACVVAIRIGTRIAGGISAPMNQLSVRMGAFAKGDINSPFPVYENEDEVGDMLSAVTATTSKLAVLIEDLVYLLDEMASGNFAIHTRCEEEYIGDFQPLLLSVRKTISQMTETLKDVKSAAEMVSAGAGNMAQASQSMAEGATEQAASTEEMQATMETITSGLDATAREVTDSYEEAVRVSGRAEASRDEMKTMTDAMQKISDTSQKIGAVIGEIEDIASQTNLLSLNASIEAARAGEAGRGFAVVADQIRALAEQSAQAAVNTRALIEGSIREVEVGNEAAARTAAALGEVVEAISGIAETSKGLSDTSQGLAESMEQAGEAMERIAEIVQSNSATAEEASATSEELSAQAASMDELVEQFRLKS